MTDISDDYDPFWDDYIDGREPPEEYLFEQQERYDRIHRDKQHGGGECDCPPAEPEYGEAPY